MKQPEDLFTKNARNNQRGRQPKIAPKIKTNTQRQREFRERHKFNFLNRNLQQDYF